MERQTRNAIRQIASKKAEAVTEELKKLQILFVQQFSLIFKTITDCNGSEFADLSNIEAVTGTQVYFAHLIIRKRN